MANLFAIEKTAVLNDKGCMPEPDEIDAQLQLIAKMLVEARAPLIYGLTRLTVEAQELAVELAMCLRGSIDTPRGSRIPSRGTSLQLQGEARTTLGEIRLYADLLVFIGVGIHIPRFLREHGLTMPVVMPCGIGDSLLWPDSAQTVLELGTRNAEEVLMLRRKLRYTPSSNEKWEETLHSWHAVQYPVLIYDPQYLNQQMGLRSAAWLIEQLERASLARAKFGRAATWPIEFVSEGLSNAAGAEYVLTAKTGYPAAVQCFSGSAEFLPGVSNAETLLSDGLIDAVLFLGEGQCDEWSDEALKHLKQIPTAMIASQEVLQDQRINHQITSCALYEEQGTILRDDGIPLRVELLSGKAESDTISNTRSTSAEVILRRLLAFVRKPAVAGTGAAQ